MNYSRVIGLLTIVIGHIALAPAMVSAQSTSRNYYIAVEGTKQGVFKADSQKAKIQGSGISYEVKPGQAGRGHNHSLVITKEAGASSPQFFAALFTNEVLKSVTIDFFKLSNTGTEEIYQTIKLTNATVLHMKQYTRQGDQQKAQTPLLEDITLALQRVEIINVPGKTTAIDDLK